MRPAVFKTAAIDLSASPPQVFKWRRERDSNPRDAKAPSGFRNRRVKPTPPSLRVVREERLELSLIRL